MTIPRPVSSTALIPTGFYRQIAYFNELADRDVPTVPANLIAAEERQAIVRYLASGTPLVSSPGLLFDPLSPVQSLSLRVLSDGVFVWPAFAAYYCETYGITPALVVCQQAIRKQGICAPVAGDLQTQLITELMSRHQPPVDWDALFDELPG
jgi:hypothetical protein